MKISLIYFTQTGQLKEILDSVISPLKEQPGTEIDTTVIRPVPEYPFPWSSDEFFDVFPESFSGIPCRIEPLDLDSGKDYDLVIIGYQPWYLSPAPPLHAFFQSNEAKDFLKGKYVLTVTGCRNMWIKALEKIRYYLNEAGAVYAGNISLTDRHNNLVSVATIIRWLFKGDKQGKNSLLPPAGVSEADIKDASRFGKIILDSFNNNDPDQLGKRLQESGSMNFNPAMAFLENNAHRIFRIWSAFILKKGNKGDINRISRVRAFKYYLLAVIYLVSPLAVAIFYLTRPFSYGKGRSI